MGYRSGRKAKRVQHLTLPKDAVSVVSVDHRVTRIEFFQRKEEAHVAGGKIPSRRCYRRVGSLRLFRDNPGGIGPEARQLETNIRGIRREI